MRSGQNAGSDDREPIGVTVVRAGYRREDLEFAACIRTDRLQLNGRQSGPVGPDVLEAVSRTMAFHGAAVGSRSRR